MTCRDADAFRVLWRVELPFRATWAARADQVVCIHDANVFRSPESYGRAFRTVYRGLLPLLASRSAATTRPGPGASP